MRTSCCKPSSGAPGAPDKSTLPTRPAFEARGSTPRPTPRWGESTCSVPGTLGDSRDEADTGKKR